MDETQSNNQINNLPKPIQELISSGVWQDKTDEIAEKYSLDNEQKEILSDDVLLALSLSIKPENFKNVLKEDLAISELLTEQLFSDLESRIFEPALKQLDQTRKETQTIKNNLPEIKPDILPMQGSNFVPPKPKLQNETLDRQKPAFAEVPRYTQAETPSFSGGIVEKKLGGVTPSINEMTKVPPPIQRYEKDPYRESLN